MSSTMTEFDPEEHPHVRYNPLRGQWVLVSPQRCQRPWSGQTEQPSTDDEQIKIRHPSTDDEQIKIQHPSTEDVQTQTQQSSTDRNPLCPGATRPNGQVNPHYESTYVFGNDFPALLDSTPSPPKSDDPLFQCAPAAGVCRVMCFHPRSDVTVPLMSLQEVTDVVSRWISELVELGERHAWVQIFENKGTVMGCSNRHPHCQIWASSFLPDEARLKDHQQLEYYRKFNRPMLMDYLHRELQLKVRLVCSNDSFVALVPYWAVWPYELLVLPRRHILRMRDLTADEQRHLADIMRQLTTRYDNLFRCDFPYSMGWHGAPTGELMSADNRHWVFHGIYYPPLLRSASVKKFMVGYEMLAQPQRDITAEKAAETLRNCSPVHYRLQSS